MNQGIEPYRPYGQPAVGTVRVTNLPPASGDTVTIAGVVYTYGTNFFGKSPKEISRSLCTAINVERADLGVTIPANPVRTVIALYIGDVVYVIATEPGTGGNSLAITTSNAASFTVTANFSGGTDGPFGGAIQDLLTVLNDIYTAVDELELKADTINLNVDELEARVGPVNEADNDGSTDTGLHGLLRHIAAKGTITNPVNVSGQVVGVTTGTPTGDVTPIPLISAGVAGQPLRGVPVVGAVATGDSVQLGSTGAVLVGGISYPAAEARFACVQSANAPTSGDTPVLISIDPVWSADSSAALEASSVTKASAGIVRSMSGRIDSTAPTATYYIQVLNASSLPADGAVSHLVIPLKIQHTTKTDSYFTRDFNEGGVAFDTGLVWCISSTEFTKTISSTYVSATVQYR